MYEGPLYGPPPMRGPPMHGPPMHGPPMYGPPMHGPPIHEILSYMGGQHDNDRNYYPEKPAPKRSLLPESVYKRLSPTRESRDTSERRKRSSEGSDKHMTEVDDRPPPSKKKVVNQEELLKKLMAVLPKKLTDRVGTTE